MNQNNLEVEFIGPLLVIERISLVEYRIQLIEDAKIKHFANIEHLKYFYSREFDADDCTLPDKYNDFMRKDVPEIVSGLHERGRLFVN